MRFPAFFGRSLLILATCLPVFGQNFPFQLRLQQDQNVLAIANGTNATVAVDAVGLFTTIKLTATYTGTTNATISAQPQLLGSTDFTVTPLTNLPLTMRPGDSFNVDVRYRASSSSRATGQLNATYVEASVRSDVPAVSGTITLNLTGTAPEYSVSYALQSDNNVVPLASGGRITFPAAVINTSPIVTIIVANRGSGAGVFNGVTLNGTAFQIGGLPLLPAAVTAAGDVRFAVRYLARRIGTDSGSVELTLGGRSFTIQLEASTVGSAFTHSLLQDPETELQPGQTIPFNDTAVGERANLTIRVRNTGNADGVLNIISISGASFGLADVPFLPVALPPDDFVTFTLSFVPQQPGRQTGRLRIGADTFELVGTGLGAQLSFSYVAEDNTTSVPPTGAVLFGAVAVGSTSRIEFIVQNTGTRAATVSSIGISEVRTAFRLEGLPRLPLTLDPDTSTAFSIVFTPAITGLASAPLLINAQSFTLTGFGNPPPPLPGYRFTGTAGTIEPLQQPGVGLTLASPYPVALRGVLTLAVDTESLPSDPAVQFASGGRTVAFTIPANSTSAVFPNSSNQIRFQSGTVAGRIILTPSFATQSGLDLTPETPDQARFTIAPAAPSLLSVQIPTTTTSGFVLVVTGFATSRSVTRLNFQFRTASDVKVPTTDFVVNVENLAANWFRNTVSQTFGGQFSVAVPFNLTVDQPPAGLTSLVQKIDRVTVTATNELGTSAPVSADVR